MLKDILTFSICFHSYFVSLFRIFEQSLSIHWYFNIHVEPVAQNTLRSEEPKEPWHSLKHLVFDSKFWTFLNIIMVNHKLELREKWQLTIIVLLSQKLFNMMFSYFITVLSVVAYTQAYSSGAPESACQDMIPRHPVEPQKHPAPYIITTSTKVRTKTNQIY